MTYFLRELMRVRKIADEEGIETPQYILAGATLGTIQKKRTNRVN